MQSWSDLVPSEQRNAEKTSFEEEGGEYFIGEQRTSNAACEGREITPVGAELIGHDEAGDDAHGKVHGEDLRPEMIEVAVYGIFLPQPYAFENGEIARQPDRDRRKDN